MHWLRAPLLAFVTTVAVIAATVETVDPRSAVALARITVGPSSLDALAPLIGILLRGQERAA